MAATGRVRLGIMGLLAVSLVACGADDDLSEGETPDAFPSVVTDPRLDVEPVSDPQMPFEPELEPASGKFPDRTGTHPDPDTPVAPVPDPASPEPAAPDPQGMTVGTLTASESRPPCGGSSTCVHAGSISGGHGEPGIEVHYDPERNDAIVRWGHALGGVISCADGGSTITACVAESPFDQSCKDEFDRLSGLADELAAFDAVFLTAGSRCRPQEGQP